MKRLTYIVSFFTILLFSSCGKRVELKNFDYEKWQNDPKACKGHRTEMEAQIREIKNELLKASENDIVETLGKPDNQELYTRSQKFFIYYLTPAPSCEGKKEQSPKILRIRFNSLGFANELMIEKYDAE